MSLNPQEVKGFQDKGFLFKEGASPSEAQAIKEECLEVHHRVIRDDFSNSRSMPLGKMKASRNCTPVIAQ